MKTKLLPFAAGAALSAIVTGSLVAAFGVDERSIMESRHEVEMNQLKHDVQKKFVNAALRGKLFVTHGPVEVKTGGMLSGALIIQHIELPAGIIVTKGVTNGYTLIKDNCIVAGDLAAGMLFNAEK